MSNPLATNPILRRFDPAVLTAFGCIILLLLIGSSINANFLSLGYLATQLQVASFLALISTGMMLVILLGQIDLSVPWIITVGGMMSTAAAGWGPMGAAFAIPVGVGCGLIFGIINGIGVAYLRVPSMIFTLSINAVAQGFMIVRTGGFAPQDMATPSMNALATGRFILGIPNPVWVWIFVGTLTVFLLRRTIFGRAVYAIGNREVAAYLSGIRTQRVVLAAFAMSGALSALAGALLDQGLSGHGRTLSSAGDRRGGARRHLDPRRPWHLSRHRGGDHPDHAPAVDPRGGPDPGGLPPADLRGGYRRHAPALRPGRQGDGIISQIQGIRTSSGAALRVCSPPPALL
jgi:ribose transport system permease protein